MIDPKVFKQVRKALGLSQQELADAIGLSRVTINKMERGKLARGIPDEIGARLMELKTRRPVEKLYRPLPDGSFIRDVLPDVNTALRGDDHLWDNEEDES